MKLLIKSQKITKHFQQNNSEAFTNENDKEIPKKIYISSEERHKTIDNIRSFIIV